MIDVIIDSPSGPGSTSGQTAIPATAVSEAEGLPGHALSAAARLDL